MYKPLDYERLNDIFVQRDGEHLTYLVLGSDEQDVFRILLLSNPLMKTYGQVPLLNDDGTPQYPFGLERVVGEEDGVLKTEYVPMDSRDRRRANKWLLERKLLSVKESTPIPGALKREDDVLARYTGQSL